MAPSFRYENLSKYYKDQHQTKVFVEKSSAFFKILFLPPVATADIPNPTVAQHVVREEPSRYKGMHRVTLALLHKAILRSLPLANPVADLLQNISGPLPIVPGEVDLRAQSDPISAPIENDGDEGVVFVDERG